MAKKGGTAGGVTLTLPNIGEVVVPILEPTDHNGVVKIAPDLAQVFRQAAEMYNQSVGELVDPYLRAVARVYLEQMKAHMSKLELADSFSKKKGSEPS